MRLEITLKNNNVYNFDSSYINTIEYENSVTDGDEIRIGVATSATLDFTLINRNNVLSGKNFDKCNVKYFDDDNNLIGTFKCTKATKSSNKKSIKFECEDHMTDLDETWLGSSMPIDAYFLLTNLCQQVGLSLLTTRDQIPNADEYINDQDGLEGETCRQVLKYLLEMFGAFATMSPNGSLIIKYYDFNNVVDTIEYGDCTDFELEEKEARRAGILFINNNSDNVLVGDTSAAYIIENNPILAQKGEDEKRNIGNNILDKIKFTTLKSGEFTVRNRDIKEGDVFKVIDEQEHEYICVASKITQKDLTTLVISSYGDTPNYNSSTSTSTSGKGAATETYSKEIYLGRGQNHQYVNIKGGTFTICEKLISNVCRFSKVNLNLFVNFNYSFNNDKIIYFDIYANDKLAKSIKFQTSQGFNQCSVGFLSDLDLENSNNLFSVRVTLEDNEIIEIQPFECQLSFIVKSCKIDDAVIDNQYFIERYKKLDMGVFNQKRCTIKRLYERPRYSYTDFIIDISAAEDNSILAFYYDDLGELDVIGNGETFDIGIESMLDRVPESSKENFLLNCKTINFVGDIQLAKGTLWASTDAKRIETINFSGNIEIWGPGTQFQNITTLKNVNIKSGDLKIKCPDCFKGCTNLESITNSNLITELSKKYSDYTTYMGHIFDGTKITYLDLSNVIIGHNSLSGSLSSDLDGLLTNMEYLQFVKLPIPICAADLTLGFNGYICNNTFSNCSANGIFYMVRDNTTNGVYRWGNFDRYTFTNSNISIIVQEGPLNYNNSWSNLLNEPFVPNDSDPIFVIDDTNYNYSERVWSDIVNDMSVWQGAGWDVRVCHNSNLTALRNICKSANDTNMASIKTQIRSITSPYFNS